MFGNLFSCPPDPASVSLEDFAKAVRAGEVSVVDVRKSYEFGAGHIPAAVNLPLSRFDPGKLPRGKSVVLVCQSGGRSRNAVSRARAAGREDIKHFAGGMSQWRLHGGETTV